MKRRKKVSGVQKWRTNFLQSFNLFIKPYRIDLLLTSLLSLLTYYAWSFLPQFTIRSDGFIYMLLTSQHNYWMSKTLPITGIQAGGFMLASFLPKLFGTNLSYYYWFELAMLLLIASLFYLVVRVIAKNNFVAFVAAIIASISYIGVYDMVSTHCFCFFFERLLIVPFLLLSFLFLHLFLEHEKALFYIISLLFYALGVGLGYFNLLITPFFLFYPVFYYFFTEQKYKKLKGLFYMLPFLALGAVFATIHLIRDGGIAPHKWTFLEFLLYPEQHLYLKKIAVQFVYWSQTPLFIGRVSVNPISDVIDYRIVDSYIPATIIIYALVAILVYILIPKQRPMLLTVIFGLIVIFYLNAYLGQYEMLVFTGSSRYLYLPSFFLAIFWAYFVWAASLHKKIILVIVGIALLTPYYFINADLIHKNSLMAIGWAKPARSIMNYVISTSQNLPSDTLVVITYPEFGVQEATFFTEQLGKNEVKYMSENNLVNAVAWEKVASASAHVRKLRFDTECECVSEEVLK